MNAAIRMVGDKFGRGDVFITDLVGSAEAMKNIVITLLRAAGFAVTDLGVDVPTERIVEAVSNEKSQVVGVSALLASTVTAQEKLIRRIGELGTIDAV